jgi:hypothetical protein
MSIKFIIKMIQMNKCKSSNTAKTAELTFALIQQCYQPVFDYTEQAPKTKMQTHSNSPAKPEP